MEHSDEVIKEDELDVSILLSHLKGNRSFQAAAGIKVTTDEAAAHIAAHNVSPGKAQRGRGKGGVVTNIVNYKSCIADLLELEKRLVKWYPRHSEALLEEVAQRLNVAFDTASGAP